MSIPRLLGIIALLLFIVFVATFFTVLVRLSRIGVTTERLAVIEGDGAVSPVPVFTRFDLLGQDPLSGRLKFVVTSRIDIRMPPFSALTDGQEVRLRIENMVPELERNIDLTAVFEAPPFGDNFVNLDFGEYEMDVVDRRDFYPFDGYEAAFNFAYYVPGDWVSSTGTWLEPKQVSIRSLTNLILLNPRYATTVSGDKAFRLRVARLRILQYLTATLVLIEILFIIYLLTIVNLQELLAKGLGYLVGLYIVRNILATNTPQFPTFIDYATLFLICVVFFLMLFKFLGGAEEHALITLPAAWRDFILGSREPQRGKGEHEDEDDERSEDA